MSFFDIFPTFEESPYSYIVVPIILVSSIIGFYYKPYFHALILHPYEVYRGKRLHTLLTSAFVHRNWAHLLFNLIVIYGLGYDMFGNIVQENDNLTAIIITPLLFSLLIIGPNLVQTILKRNNFLFTAVGSSGLTFGLFGFSFLFFPLQQTESHILPFIKNSFSYWLSAIVLLFLLLNVGETKVNKRLHIIAFFIGSIIALFTRPASFIEIIHFLFA